MPKARKIAFLKCNQCRKDRQKCLPEKRLWPGERCGRCEKYDYPCSESLKKGEEARRRPVGNPHHCVSVNDATNSVRAFSDSPVGFGEPFGEVCSTGRVNQCLEELRYLQWLSNRLKPVGYQIGRFKDLIPHIRWGSSETSPQLPSIQNFIKKFDSVYQNAIHAAENLAVEGGPIKVSQMDIIGQHLLEYHANFRQDGGSCGNFLSMGGEHVFLLTKMVDFYEEKGDFLAAQTNQERLLDVLTGIFGNSEPSHEADIAKAAQRLIGLYNKSLGRLEMIARKLGLDVPRVLRVAPLLHQSVCRDNPLLTSAVISQLDGYDQCLDIIGRTAIHCAAESNARESLSCLLKKDICLGMRDSFGWTALQTAARNGHLEIVRMILSKSVDVNAGPAFHYGRTALQAAAEGGHLEVVKLLISKSANVDAGPAPYYGKTALVAAVEKGHQDVVDFLVSKSADFNAATGYLPAGTTPQATSHGRGNSEAAKPLVSGGNATMGYVQSGEATAERDHLEVLKFLISGPAGASFLLERATAGDLEAVIFSISRSTGINAGPAFCAAAGNGHLDVVEFLLSTSIDIDAHPAGDGARTALQAAAEGGHLEVVEFLVSKSADINAAPAKVGGRTALQAAAGGGKLEVVEFLTYEEADIDAPPALNRGRTALQAAAGGGHLEVVEFLTYEEVDINAGPAPNCGRTGLQAAAEGGHLEVVEFLVSELTDINAGPAPHCGRTALQAAAEGGHLEVVQFLVSKLADINADPAPHRGRTALQAAAEGGHLEVVEFLVSESADIDAAPAPRRGRTALQAAAEEGHLEVVQFLVSKSADINAAPAPRRGRTALQAAAEGGHLDIVELLISKSANVNARAAEFGGRTALQAAAEGGHLRVVKLLLANGAYVYALRAKSQGLTAIDAATRSGDSEIIHLLSTYLNM